MGYQTCYKLSCNEQDPQKRAQIQEEIKEILCIKISLNELSDSVKWYEYPDDMRELSLRFPGVLFTLIGYGEGPGDVWKKGFLGGNLILKYKIEFVEDNE